MVTLEQLSFSVTMTCVNDKQISESTTQPLP
jgi:hypothetical protein